MHFSADSHEIDYCNSPIYSHVRVSPITRDDSCASPFPDDDSTLYYKVVGYGYQLAVGLIASAAFFERLN